MQNYDVVRMLTEIRDILDDRLPPKAAPPPPPEPQPQPKNFQDAVRTKPPSGPIHRK